MGTHQYQGMGWNPPTEISEWVRAEAKRQRTTLSTVLNEAVGALQALTEVQGGPFAVLCPEHEPGYKVLAENATFALAVTEVVHHCKMSGHVADVLRQAEWERLLHWYTTEGTKP